MNNNANNTDLPEPPIYVDLDGTLIKTDVLVESFFALLKRNALYLFLIPLWLLKGKAHLKQEIADRVDLDAGLLPYNDEFLAYLKEQAAQGRRLYLATASNEKFAHAIAAHLGCFDGVIASDREVNRNGSRKLELMLQNCGEAGFDYAGNARIDLQIWPHARSAILVNPHRGVKNAVDRIGNTGKIFENRQAWPLPYIKAMRPHQWMKNLLLFVPLLTSHQWQDSASIASVLLAFCAFSLCASSVYLLNDLLDLPSDRSHPNKRNRPFASGNASLIGGLALMFALIAAGIGIGTLLSIKFLGILLVYLTITLAYSLVLKSVAMVDVVILAGLYTLRVIAGAIAISVIPSFWLLAFSMFVFLSLALVKRCSELDTIKQLDGEAAWGRNYRVDDLDALRSMGVASGYLSVLVLALFINSPEVVARYTHPQGLWLLCPTIAFWIGHIWLKTARGQVHDDPLVFAITNRGSQMVIAACVLISVLSI